MVIPHPARCLLGSLTLFLLSAPVLSAQQPGADFFEKQVRPLLAARCFTCHSGTGAPAMGGLRLDSREALLKGGARGPAIVPGKPGESLLIEAIRQTTKLRMPPSGSLDANEVAILTEWVAQGAPWGAEAALASGSGQPFWSFVPPKEPALPTVKNSAWVQSPIDRFILAALEAKGLTPAPPADKRTLLRRATYDLTGLPPTPTEIRDFLADDSPEAFAKVIDRLLDSPRYGERWARHWLDIARYADSNGLDENLVYRNAWRYRDYVIAAFNKDKPYDRFIHEQLAGDLLPDTGDLADTFERWTATGFLSLGAKMLAEDDPVKMQMDIVDEQLDTTGRAFMGLTLGCARCHDHKFDPISQADYYGLAGIFKSAKTMEDFNVVARWHEFVLAPEADRNRLQAHLDRIEAKNREITAIADVENRKLVADGRQRVGQYLMAATDALADELTKLEPAADRAAKPALEIAAEAGTFASGNVNRILERGKTNVPAEPALTADERYFAEYFVEVPRAGHYQIDFLEQEKGSGTADILVNGVLVKKGAEPVRNRAASPEAGGWTVAGIFPLEAGKNTIRLEHDSRFPYFEKFLLTPNALPAGTRIPETPEQLARRYTVNPGFLAQWVEFLRRSKGAVHSPFYAWLTYGTSEPLEAWTSPAAALFRDFQRTNREALAARYEQLAREAVAQWQTLYPDEDVNFRKAERYRKDDDAKKLPDAGLEAIREVLYEKFGPFRPPADARQYYPKTAQDRIAAIEAQRKQLEEETPEFPRAMGVTEGGEIADIPIHLRGSHWTLGEIVPRRFPLMLVSDRQPELDSSASGRLELAHWLTDAKHPLTSRVMVNRLWRWHFGRGIVPSTDNFGRLGDKPTNQPLLDWLALRFIENGWSIKRMHRLIMLSSTYRMSSTYDEKAAAADPENTLHWRANRRRLEAEAIRDAVMAFSGDLAFSMGGSLLSYKDRQYVSNTARGGRIDYDRNRRAVYIPVVRSSMYDVFTAFDFADPSVSNGDRGETVVAPQALFVMNGSVVLTHSRKLAESLLARADADDTARIREAYERAFGRLPESGEIDRALTFLARIERALAERVEDPAERRLRAWQSFAKGLIASNEFVYLN
jgi:hypothetical protein